MIILNTYLPTDADLEKWGRFKQSIATDAYLNSSDEFYGKIERRITQSHEYTHPVIDKGKPHIQSRAKYECMQIRQKEISDDKNNEKYSSINNCGVKEPGIIIKRFNVDPDMQHIEGDVYDSNTRVIITRAVERDHPTRAKINIKQAFVTDRDLCDWLRMHSEFFQNGANDHDPAENSSDIDIKKSIANKIASTPANIRNTDEFKERLKVIMRAVATSRPKETISKWVNQAYKTRQSNANGIVNYNDRHHRQSAMRDALVKKIGPLQKSEWVVNTKGNVGLDHENYKIYAVSSAKGSLEKAAGGEDWRKGKNDPKDQRHSICVGFISDGTTADSITEAQYSFFAKIDVMSTTKVRKTCFDSVYVIGQEHSVDLGKLLSKAEVYKKYKNLQAKRAAEKNKETPKLKVVEKLKHR